MLWVGQVLGRHTAQVGADLFGIGLGGIARIVANHQVVLGIHAGAGELLELHLHELALVAQLDNAILKFGLCLLHDLEARENTGNVGERNVVIELEGRQAQQGAIERLTGGLERGDELVDRAHDGGDRLDLVALTVDVHVDDGTTSRNRDHDGVGEHRHASGSTVTHARLTRGERGIGIEVEVGAQDLGEVAIDNDGAVHLGKLEQAVRGKRNVEREAVVTSSEHVFGVADADKGAQVTSNDHVEGGANRLAGGSQANSLFHTLLQLVLIQGIAPIVYAP